MKPEDRAWKQFEAAAATDFERMKTRWAAEDWRERRRFEDWRERFVVRSIVFSLFFAIGIIVGRAI